ncbi:MAG: hypothetical protein J6N22_03940, partial [Schwartzia sp.]|nr:hypothetical protein [Schwartzia sp. (in: firmicutes)]
VLYEAKQNGKHGYCVYSEERGEGMEQSSSSLVDLGIVLDERNPSNGAMKISFEEFRTVYRFLQRTLGVFNKPISLLRFSLPKGTPLETEEEFLSMLCTTLRTGDVVTKNGVHYLVLLVNTDFPNLSHAADRLRKSWVLQHEDEDFDYEWTVLEP